MNVFGKEQKIVSFFFRQTQDQRKEESMQLWIGSRPRFERKGSVYNQDEWLREIEEHERKSNRSEKQSVEMNLLKLFQIRLEEAEEARFQRRRCPLCL